jgi:hypothetical protein
MVRYKSKYLLIGTLPWYFDWNITMVFQFVSCHGISICILPWLYGYVPHLGIFIRTLPWKYHGNVPIKIPW